MFNQKFDMALTESKMKSLRSNYKIRSGITHSERRRRANQSRRLFSTEQEAFVRKNAKGKTNKELTELINRTFDLKLTIAQIKGWKANHKVSSGLTGYFERGHVPINKGTKGMFNVGGNKTSFQKGQIPQNYRPIGFERVDSYGYVVVKVQDHGSWPKRWRQKHKIEWEKVNGPIPEGKVLIFLDGNKQNTDLENLKLVTQGQNLQLNRKQWRSENPEATLAGVSLAQLQEKVIKRKKRAHTSSR
ncbi:HNH endonuclease signature motif containing protein [Enterococcus sp. AZ051]|uniref:HNH endonuclease signature motif containing protein n=1 Tax=Enterococcus sp. AZ051 TaxID=2774698 RepID=UPI003D2A702B